MTERRTPSANQQTLYLPARPVPAPVPPSPPKAPKKKPAITDPQTPQFRPRRSQRTYLTRAGSKVRGHHIRGDRPGHVTCPHCALGDVPAELGARCTVPGCGAVVTEIKEAL